MTPLIIIRFIWTGLVLRQGYIHVKVAQIEHKTPIEKKNSVFRWVRG